MSRSDWQVPKKLTRAIGSPARKEWRATEQFKRLDADVRNLVKETEATVASLKGRKSSLGRVHEAVMLDTKLRRLLGVLTVAEERERAFNERKKRRGSRQARRKNAREVAKETVVSRTQCSREVGTLISVGVTSIFCLLAVAWLAGLDTWRCILVTAVGPTVILIISDHLLKRATSHDRGGESS